MIIISEKLFSIINIIDSYQEKIYRIQKEFPRLNSTNSKELYRYHRLKLLAEKEFDILTKGFYTSSGDNIKDYLRPLIT